MFGFIEDESPSPESPDEELLDTLARSKVLEPGGRTLILSSFDPFNQEELWREPTTGPEQQTSETTHTSDSFNTAPVNSKLDERIVDNTTEQRNTETDLEINMAQPNSDMQPPVTNRSKPIELKINPLKPFSRKRDEFGKFLQDVTLYLEVNNEIYNSNKKKIAYTLSFMNDGDAAAWKSQFLTDATTPNGLNLTGWTQFRSEERRVGKECSS